VTDIGNNRFSDENRIGAACDTFSISNMILKWCIKIEVDLSLNQFDTLMI
jgi:hypothetical protein